MASYSKKAIQEISVKSNKLKVSQISFIKDGKNDKKSFEIKYYPWTGVNKIRSQIASKNSVPPKNVRLFFKNEELLSNLKMIDYGIPFHKHPEIFYEIFSYKNDYSLEIYGTILSFDFRKNNKRSLEWLRQRFKAQITRGRH